MSLGHEMLTDVAEVQFFGLDDAGAAWAIGSALRETVTRYLGIEPREIGLHVDARSAPLGSRTHSIFLFDQNAGGAGYVPRLFDDLPARMHETRDRLNCPQACAQGCSACVLSPDLYAQQELIDRCSALDFVDRLLAQIAQPNADDRAVEGAQLSAPVADALAQRLRRDAVMTLFVPTDADLSRLSDPPLAQLLAAASETGTHTRIAVAPELFDVLDRAARQGFRNASHRQNFTIALSDAPCAVNAAILVASLTTGDQTTGWFARDRETLMPGTDWGVGVDHPIVSGPIAAPETQPINPAEMESRLTPSDCVTLIGNAPSIGPLNSEASLSAKCYGRN